MQILGNRSKTILGVLTGVTTGLGIALWTSRTGSRFFMKYLRSSSTTKRHWNLTVNVAGNETQCETVIDKLRRDIEVSKVLGFDCEWVQINNIRNPVALIQLATQEGQCGLFQIHFYSSIPSSLKDLLEDQSILKVGVDPGLDAKHLMKDFGIKVAGTYDIRHLVDGKEVVGGLAAVVNSELGVELPKDLSVRVSNWEAEQLTPEQQVYAAYDALAAVMTYFSLIGKKVKVPFFASKEEQWKTIYDYCLPLIDVRYKSKKNVPPSPLFSPAESSSSFGMDRDKSGQPRATNPSLQGKRSYRAFCPRKSPLYENAFMLAPDGDVLCTCDTKKAEWYVSKGLATLVAQEPLKIQLTFEPSGRVQGPSAEYYTLEKQNQCVSCGRKDSYVRKKVVPHEYRRYFPDCMKKHQSHDVLLLCAPCHAQSNIADLSLRMELAQLCKAPIVCDENTRVVEDHKKKELRSAARALLNKSNKLPETRHKELLEFIQENCQSSVTPELLSDLKNMDIMIVNEDFTPHGLLVVEHFAREGIVGLMKLEKMWREHFINVMAPK